MEKIDKTTPISSKGRELVEAFRHPYFTAEDQDRIHNWRHIEQSPVLNPMVRRTIIQLLERARKEGIIDGIAFALGENVTSVEKLQKELFTPEAISGRANFCKTR